MDPLRQGNKVAAPRASEGRRRQAHAAPTKNQDPAPPADALALSHAHRQQQAPAVTDQVVMQNALDAGTAGATVINRVGTVAGNDNLTRLATSPAGAINVARGIVDLHESGKVDEQAVSALATGAGTLLAGKVPEASVLLLVGNAAGLPARQKDLERGLHTMEPRSLVGSIAGTLEGVVGLGVAAAKTVDILARHGARWGVVKPAAARTGVVAGRVTAAATKTIIPFAAVGTVLSGWDWEIRMRQLHKTRQQLHQAETHFAGESKLIAGLQRKEHVLRSNTRWSGAAFGLSGVSTTALAVAAAAPPTAPVAVPVAIATGIGSAVAGVLAEPALRDWTARKLHLR
ncbi:MAG: hypothetical protein JOY51_07085 [Nevskia sp.]|nr:hypothetical protein [Nevskia sp.]